MTAVVIARRDLTAAELRAAAGRTRDARAARRMLALALVLEGTDRTSAAKTCGMDRQTLRDWVHRYNAEGLAGLVNRRAPARPRQLTPTQMAELAAWVEAGPDPERDGVVRWRRRDLARRIEGSFGVEVHERTVGKYLAALGYRRLSVRPRHPKADHAAQAAFKRVSGGGSGGDPRARPRQAARAVVPGVSHRAAIGSRPMANARVGQQGTLTRVWARRGSRPRALRDTRYEWAYLFDAVCPARGVAAGLVLPYADTAAMNAHLAEIAGAVAPGAHAVLVLDGAGWHGGKGLVVPDAISLLTLPPYAPELNPVENVWQFLRANWLAISVFDGYDAIVTACCAAWNRFADDPAAVASITSREWAQVNA